MRANPYARTCGSRQVLDRIGDTWSVLIVLALRDGSMRYSELAHRVEGVSQKMLTQTLRGLERDGLLTRSVEASVPPKVDYTLTALGHSLLDLVAAMEEWATSHLGDVLAARRRYDER